MLMRGCPYCGLMGERVVGMARRWDAPMHTSRKVSCACGAVDRTVALYPFLAAAAPAYSTSPARPAGQR